MQVANPGTPAALPKLLLYLLAVMIGGALLAPPLLDLGNAAHGWLANTPLQAFSPVRSLMKSIEHAHFSRYFNRAVLVCAIAFIFPLLRSLKVDRSLLPAWRPLSSGLLQWFVGFKLAAGLLLVMGAVFHVLGAYYLRQNPAWTAFGTPLTAALGAGIVEEFFFRGLLLGLLLRTLPPMRAALACTFIFAIVHFLKPPSNWEIADEAVIWSSGFAVLGQIARGFGDVDFLLAEFATLFAVGWVLARVRLHTGSLWAGIGLHGGWVFGLKYFSALSRHDPGWLPWIGNNLKIGLVPLLVVLLTGWLAQRLLPRQSA